MACLKSCLKPLAEDGAATDPRAGRRGASRNPLRRASPRSKSPPCSPCSPPAANKPPNSPASLTSCAQQCHAGSPHRCRARRTGRYLRHRRRRPADFQHLFRRGPGGRRRRSQSRQARQSRRHLAMRFSRRARSPRRPRHAHPRTGRRMPARDRLHVSLRPALPSRHGAFGPLRRALGFRTIFNLCGPLTNPAGARAQVIGVLAPSRVLLVGRTLARSRRAAAPSSFMAPTASMN